MDYLLDSDTCIDILRGHPKVLGVYANLGIGVCAVSVISWTELSMGVTKGTSPKRESRLNDFIENLRVLDLTKKDGSEIAMVRAHLEINGTPIGPYDTQLAGHALSLGLTLVTDNLREFSRVPGLNCVSWR